MFKNEGCSRETKIFRPKEQPISKFLEYFWVVNHQKRDTQDANKNFGQKRIKQATDGPAYLLNYAGNLSSDPFMLIPLHSKPLEQIKW